MSILGDLSSSLGERTEGANRAVVERIKKDLTLLDDIVNGLRTSNVKLVGDCAEVFTMIAEENPQAIIPYFSYLPPLLKTKNTRVRWEAMHTIRFVAREIPDQIEEIIPMLVNAIHKDTSVIVRDYAIQAIGEYASTSVKAAQMAFPHLLDALSVWNEKHTHLAIDGLRKAVVVDPSLGSKAFEAALPYASHAKPKIRSSANALLKLMK